jgi:hypothetical protein
LLCRGWVCGDAPAAAAPATHHLDAPAQRRAVAHVQARQAAKGERSKKKGGAVKGKKKAKK